MTNLHLLRGKEKARIIRQNAVLKRKLTRTRNSILTQQQEISEYEETLEIAFDELDSSLYNEPTIKLIQSDIAKLFNTKPQARRYTRETKEFAYSLLVKSESCYNFLRRVIPLPSPELLRKEFKDDVNKEERRMIISATTGQAFFVGSSELRTSVQIKANDYIKEMFDNEVI